MTFRNAFIRPRLELWIWFDCSIFLLSQSFRMRELHSDCLRLSHMQCKLCHSKATPFGKVFSCLLTWAKIFKHSFGQLWSWKSCFPSELCPGPHEQKAIPTSPFSFWEGLYYQPKENKILPSILQKRLLDNCFWILTPDTNLNLFWG